MFKTYPKFRIKSTISQNWCVHNVSGTDAWMQLITKSLHCTLAGDKQGIHWTVKNISFVETCEEFLLRWKPLKNALPLRSDDAHNCTWTSEIFPANCMAGVTILSASCHFKKQWNLQLFSYSITTIIVSHFKMCTYFCITHSIVAKG